MALNESTIMDRINKRIHNAKAKLGGDTALRAIMNDGLRDIRLDLDLVGAERTSTPFLIFNDVHPTAVPSDIDYDKAIDIRCEDKDWEHLEWNRVDSKQFLKVQNPVGSDSTGGWLLNSSIDNRNESNRNIFSITFQDSSPYMLIRNNVSDLSSAKITPTVSLTADGTWAVADDGTNLRLDTQRFKADSASIAFDSSGGATDVTLSNTDFTDVDLSSYEDKGYVFIWLHLPSTVPSSVTATWGNDASNHWAKSATTQHNGLAFKPGWNLISFDWGNSPTETGSPDATAIDYFKVTITNASATALVGYRLDEVWCRLGKEVVMDYYSKHLVATSAGVRQESFVTSSDTILLEGQEVNVFIDKCSEIASDMLREQGDASKFLSNYDKKSNKIKERFPSKNELEGTTYHII